MAKWRSKEMVLAEWAAFQNAAEEYQVRIGGDPDFALFVQGMGSGPQTIYFTSPYPDLVEAMSPGGWRDSDTPSGPHLSLLVAADDPWERFGIEKPHY